MTFFIAAAATPAAAAAPPAAVAPDAAVAPAAAATPAAAAAAATATTAAATASYNHSRRPQPQPLLQTLLQPQASPPPKFGLRSQSLKSRSPAPK